MGFLAPTGAAIGQAFAPTATAAATAQSALGWGTFSTAANVTGDLLSGIAAGQQANFAAKVAGQDAFAARAAGQYEESAAKGRTTAAVASAKAAQAANGVSVDSGSAENVRGAIQRFGDLDAAMIHYNAARQAYADEAQAGLYKMAGRNAAVGSLFKAGSSFLTGARSLSDKWLAYQRSGALAGG